MKIAFIIDKTQTFQIIAKVLKVAIARNHECDLYCCFERDQLENIKDYYGKNIRLKWISDKNRINLIAKLSKNRHSYNAVIGINFYNKALKPIFENKNLNNYSLEYCWNELYNSKESKDLKFKSGGTLFCNSPVTKKMIGKIIGDDNLDYLGSPWYEFLDENKVVDKSKKIVFMAPHQSFYNRVLGLRKYVELFLYVLQEYCRKNEYELLLKTRSKYSESYNNIKHINNITSDTNLGDHIEAYKDSKLVINFCSSAINELTYLQVPFLVIGPKIQKDLHPQSHHDEAIKLIHENYYSGNIFDKIHCEGIEIEKHLDIDNLEKIFDRLILSEKDWNGFQTKFFCGNFLGSSNRILLRVEENEIKRNSTN